MSASDFGADENTLLVERLLSFFPTEESLNKKIRVLGVDVHVLSCVLADITIGKAPSNTPTLSLHGFSKSQDALFARLQCICNSILKRNGFTFRLQLLHLSPRLLSQLEVREGSFVKLTTGISYKTHVPRTEQAEEELREMKKGEDMIESATAVENKVANTIAEGPSTVTRDIDSPLADPFTDDRDKDLRIVNQVSDRESEAAALLVPSPPVPKENIRPYYSLSHKFIASVISDILSITSREQASAEGEEEAELEAASSHIIPQSLLYLEKHSAAAQLSKVESCVHRLCDNYEELILKLRTMHEDALQAANLRLFIIQTALDAALERGHKVTGAATNILPQSPS